MAVELTYNGTNLGKWNVQIKLQAVYGQTNRRMYKRIWWNCRKVQVNNLSRAALQSDLEAAEAALAVDGGDIILTDTHHQILSANTMNGVRITHGPEYPRRSYLGGGMNGEYNRFRSWGFTAQAEILNVETEIAYWKESMRFIGTGGPDFVIQEPLNGNPIPQTTTDATSFKVIQYGMAVGVTGEPAIPAPIAIGNLKPKLHDYQPFTPEGWGVFQDTLYGVKWTYVHEAANALSGIFGVPF